MDKWWLIRNPVAGSGRAEKEWQQIATALDAAGIHYEAQASQAYEHAITLAAEGYQSGFRHFLVIGGDGTVNEVINGIAEHHPERLQQITLGLIPVGKGNDWRRSLGLPTDYTAIARSIASGQTLTQDVGSVTYQGPTGELQYRLFVNMAGIGFDGAVTQSVNQKTKDGKPLSKMAYLWQLLNTLLHHDSQKAKLTGPSKRQEVLLFSAAIGKGQYNGGGMRQTPHAQLDDGQLAITLIHDLPKWEVVANVTRLFAGTFVKHRKVEIFHSEEFGVTNPGLLLETDGESLGHTPATFQVLPRYLRVVVPEK